MKRVYVNGFISWKTIECNVDELVCDCYQAVDLINVKWIPVTDDKINSTQQATSPYSYQPEITNII